MLWFKKKKVHEPFGNDFNLVTIWVSPPFGSRYIPRYTIPDNWYCQLISVTLSATSGAFGKIRPFIHVQRRGRYAWIFPWGKEIPAGETYQICWGIGLPSSPLEATTKMATAPIADQCFLEGGDMIRFEVLSPPIDAVLKFATIYLKQWILY